MPLIDQTHQCGFPAACLWLEPFRFLLNGVLTKTRPMDNIPLTMSVPQEDELAVTVGNKLDETTRAQTRPHHCRPCPGWPQPTRRCSS